MREVNHRAKWRQGKHFGKALALRAPGRPGVFPHPGTRGKKWQESRRRIAVSRSSVRVEEIQ